MQDAIAKAKEKRAGLVTHLVGNGLANARDIAVSASHEFGVPLLDLDSVAVDLDAVRVVSDNARHSIPRFAFKGLTPDGRVNRWSVIIPMLMAPHKFPALVRLAETTKTATKRLRKLADAGLARGFFAG